MYKRIYDSDEITVDYYNDGKPMIRISQFEDNHWRDEHFVEGLELVVHAHWEFRELSQIAPNCSHCGVQSIMGYSRCPHCGAHMDEEVEHG